MAPHAMIASGVHLARLRSDIAPSPIALVENMEKDRLCHSGLLAVGVALA